MTSSLEQLGEFGLIRRLVERLPSAPDVVVGPGDDCAVIDNGRRSKLLATSDMLVEGRHFDLALSSPADVGFKSIAVNVSDVSACAGQPWFALVALGVPRSMSVRALDALYDGMAEAASAYGVAIVGGDTVVADLLTISVALVGRADEPVLRSGARAGDAVCVTGRLGAAAAGLWLLRAAGEGDRDAGALLERYPALALAHRRARARVREARAVAPWARAMIDISDGLGQDLGHVCEASGVGAELSSSALPLAEGLADVAAWRGVRAASIALAGGDDYELCIAVDPERWDDARAAVAPEELTLIGRFCDRPGVTVDGDVPVGDAGWDHFA